MVSKGLVKVESLKGLHIKACHPHRTDKHYPEWVIRVFEFGCQVLFHHSFSVFGYVQTQLFKLIYFVLFLTHNNSHISVFHVLYLCFDLFFIRKSPHPLFSKVGQGGLLIADMLVNAFLSFSICCFQYFCTLSYILTAVGLSTENTIAFPC